MTTEVDFETGPDGSINVAIVIGLARTHVSVSGEWVRRYRQDGTLEEKLVKACIASHEDLIARTR